MQTTAAETAAAMGGFKEPILNAKQPRAQSMEPKQLSAAQLLANGGTQQPTTHTLLVFIV